VQQGRGQGRQTACALQLAHQLPRLVVAAFGLPGWAEGDGQQAVGLREQIVCQRVLQHQLRQRMGPGGLGAKLELRHHIDPRPLVAHARHALRQRARAGFGAATAQRQPRCQRQGALRAARQQARVLAAAVGADGFAAPRAADGAQGG